MSIISGAFNVAAQRVLIPCDVAASGSVLAVRKTNNTSTAVSTNRTFALVDTGATNTCISDYLANQMNLNHNGLIDLTTAGGMTQSKLYTIDLILNFLDHHVPVEFLRVTAVTLPQESEFHIILGMDLLLRGHMSLSRDGHFLFAL